MHPFIVLEGLDGSGKTTVGSALAERIEGVYYKTPPAAFLDFREIFESPKNKTARFYFYLSALHVATNEIKEMLTHSPVVCDRYSLSTRAYNEVTLERELGMYFGEHEFLLPTTTVFLEVRTEERNKRLNVRDKLKYYEKKEGYLENVHTRYKELLSTMENVIVFDTSEKGVDQIVDDIIQNLEQNRGMHFQYE